MISPASWGRNKKLLLDLNSSRNYWGVAFRTKNMFAPNYSSRAQFIRCLNSLIAREHSQSDLDEQSVRKKDPLGTSSAFLINLSSFQLFTVFRLLIVFYIFQKISPPHDEEFFVLF